MKKLKHLIATAENEAYQYFHQQIRSLPKTKTNQWDFKTGEFHNNDVDAFRHAYVSGVLTQKFDDITANILGQLKELEGDIKRNQSDEEKNMDLWNNHVGRQYGQKTNSKSQLLNRIHKALNNGELIVTVDQHKDTRIYQSFDYFQSVDPEKPIVVVEENETGRNDWFLDLIKGILLPRERFVKEIESGNYPGYRLVDINSLKTPKSKPDSKLSNNLG